MNEDVLNVSVRKFLKTVGVTSQREIEKAVREAVASGRLKGNEKLPAKMTLTVGGINLSHIPGAGDCFPSFLAETRSSAGPSTGLSLQAQLKDIAFGKFQQCGVSIKITPDKVNKVGDPHTFTVHVDKTVGGAPTP